MYVFEPGKVSFLLHTRETFRGSHCFISIVTFLFHANLVEHFINILTMTQTHHFYNIVSYIITYKYLMIGYTVRYIRHTVRKGPNTTYTVSVNSNNVYRQQFAYGTKSVLPALIFEYHIRHLLASVLTRPKCPHLSFFIIFTFCLDIQYAQLSMVANSKSLDRGKLSW